MKKLLLFITLLFQISTITASNNAGAFLEKSMGPRPTAMGFAYAAAATDANSIYLNPAGLTNIERQHVSVHNYNAFETSYFGAQGSFKWESVQFGMGLVRANVSDINEVIRNDSGNLEKTGTSFAYTGYALYFGGAQTFFNKLSIGANAKYIQETLFNSAGTGIGFDMGSQFMLTEWLRLGAAVQNITPTEIKWENTTEKMPRTITLGTLIYVNELQSLSMDVKKKQGRPMTYHFGTEYFITPYFPLRLGYDDSEFSIGLGLYFDQLSADFSFTNLDDFVQDDIYKFGLTYYFKSQYENEYVPPAIPTYTYVPEVEDVPEVVIPDPIIRVKLDELTTIRKSRRVMGVSGTVEHIETLTINDQKVHVRPDNKFYKVVTLSEDESFILTFKGISPSKKEVSVIKYFLRE
jgi:hypothetical protein